MKNKFYKQIGIVSSSDLRTKKGRIVYSIMILVLLIVCCASLFPSIWALLTGFKETKEIYSSMSFFPKNFQWSVAKSRVADALSIMQFWKMSGNTLIVSLGSAFFAILVSGLGGYVISRIKPKGVEVIFALIVWTMMMPEQIRTVPIYISYLSFPFAAELPGEVSLLNTYWPIWLGAAANCFNVLLFKNHFDSISASLVEAAKLDGCGNGRIFFSIMVPLSKPIMLYVAIMSMKGAWSDFFLPYLTITDQKLMTLPEKIFILKSEPSMQMDRYLLCIILSCLPMLTLFALFSRQITEGINVGGVKG